MDQTKTSHLKFAQRWMPWIIAAAGLLVYVLTLVRWGTYTGLPVVAKITGWDWRPVFHAPLHYLTTLPITWLPSEWQLTATSFFAAVCASLSLGLLARSVTLLPHDRTKDQRVLERSDYSFLSGPIAWIPPLFACVVCGLQLSFWEHSILNTGEAFDLLLFAFVVWSLLEYRYDEKNWRLILATFVFGLAMTNNYAMVAFSPAYLVALVWIKGMAFFRRRFMVMAAGAGLAGLLLYFLLPFIVSRSGMTQLNFWEILLVNLGFQKNAIAGFPRYILLITGLTSLVPVAFIGIRWPATVGDVNPAGAKLTTYMTHMIHGVLMVAALYVAFDPPFSPRNLGGGLAFLPLYFLGALSVGYFTGYLLLICGAKPVRSWEKPSAIIRGLNRVVLILIWASIVILPLLLSLKNYPEIITRNGKELQAFGQSAANSLPEGPALILSDDATRAFALQAALSQSNPGHSYIVADNASMQSASFHKIIHEKHPQLWPNTFAAQPSWSGIEDTALFNFVVGISKAMPVFYLHPSFGYYFEHFYAKPHQRIFQLLPLPEIPNDIPVLTPEEIADIDRVWSAYYNESLLPSTREISRLMRSKDLNRQLAYTGQIHATDLNFLGVEFQRAGRLDKAREYFDHALALNPFNPVAMINTNFNTVLHHPEIQLPELQGDVKKILQTYQGDWNSILGANGPVDEPTSRFFLAQAFLQGNNPRQAIQQLLRAQKFLPHFYPIYLSLAGAYVKINRGQDALRVISDLRSLTNTANFPLEVRMPLLNVEAWALAANNEFPKAEALVRQAQTDFPKESTPFTALANIYWSSGRHTNAMEVYELQLQSQPGNIDARISLSAFQISTGKAREAVANMDEALKLNPKNLGVLMNRAIANLTLQNTADARRDYLAIKSLSSRPIPAVFYGLGECAWLEKDFKTAVTHFEEFLKYAPKTSVEYRQTDARIRAIKTGNIPNIPAPNTN